MWDCHTPYSTQHPHTKAGRNPLFSEKSNGPIQCLQLQSYDFGVVPNLSKVYFLSTGMPARRLATFFAFSIS